MWSTRNIQPDFLSLYCYAPLMREVTYKEKEIEVTENTYREMMRQMHINEEAVAPEEIKDFQMSSYVETRKRIMLQYLKFEIDGQEIAKEKIAFSLNGKEFTISDLPELNHEYWYVMKPATIRVQQIGGIAPGDHTLRVYMKHRVPYTGYFGQYLTLISDRTETLAAEQ